MKLIKNKSFALLLMLFFLSIGTVNAAGMITPRFEHDFSGDYSSKGLAINLWSGSGWFGGASYNEAAYSQINAYDTSLNTGYQFSGGAAVSVDYYKNAVPEILFETYSATFSFPLKFVSDGLADTHFSLNVGKSRYETDTTKNRVLNRHDYMLGLSQTITSNWRMGGSYSWYHYIEDLDKAETLLIKQKIKNAAIVNALLGLFDHQWGTWTEYEMSDRSRLSFSFNDGEKFFFGRTRTYIAGYDYRLTKTTEVGVQLTRVKDGEEVGRYVALSVSYYF